MSAKSWKAVERKHSEMLHCYGRTGPTGLDLPDSFSDVLAVESKSRKEIPGWIVDHINQSTENAARLESKLGLQAGALLPVVVLHPDGNSYESDVVMLRLDYFIERLLPWLED